LLSFSFLFLFLYPFHGLHPDVGQSTDSNSQGNIAFERPYLTFRGERDPQPYIFVPEPVHSQVYCQQSLTTLAFRCKHSDPSSSCPESERCQVFAKVEEEAAAGQRTYRWLDSSSMDSAFRRQANQPLEQADDCSCPSRFRKRVRLFLLTTRRQN